MLYAVILAGGKGTRLYPLSRNDNPKQFLKVFDDKSFLRNTVDRIAKIISKENIYVITNSSYIERVVEELPDIKKENIFAEPENKETATCIALSAIKLLKKDKDAKMVILPSDHYVMGEKEFLNSIYTGVAISDRRRALVGIGVKPTRPETGYGYIKIGEKVKNSLESSYKIERFVEKPNSAVANELLFSGKYLWNSGMYIWRADVFVREVEKYLPEMYKSMMKIYQSLGNSDEKFVIEDEYSKIDGISVDYGIMQKTRKGYVVESSFIWDDIGNFKALGKYKEKFRSKDEENRIFEEECDNCIVFNDERMVITFGVEDLIIVDSKDVLLVMRQDKDQEVKQLVDKMIKTNNYKKYI